MSEPKQVPPPCQREFDQDKLILKLDQVVPSDISLIEEVVAKIVTLIQQTGCHEVLEKTELALHEALANAILHGNRSHPTKAVRVCVAVEQDCGMLIVVKDAGSGFDPARLPNPLVGENLLAQHGRGIFIINQLMDDVRFGYDSGTAVYMRRNPRDPSAEHQPAAGANTETGRLEAGRGKAVVVYTQPACQICARVKGFLLQKGVEFAERDVTTDEDALEALARFDYSRLPVTVIDGEVVGGFDRERLEALLR